MSHLQVLHNTYPDKDHLWDNYERLKFVPFNPTDKFTMAIVKDKQSGKVCPHGWARAGVGFGSFSGYRCL